MGRGFDFRDTNTDHGDTDMRDRDDLIPNDRTDARTDERLGREVREDEARLTLSEEQLAIGKRQREAGEVELGKTVETRHVSESVPTAHEEVTIERRPLDGMSAAGAEIREEHLSVPVTREEVVAEKKVVPREEIVARKHQVVENQAVEADLRREDVEVRERGDVELRDEDRGRRDGML